MKLKIDKVKNNTVKICDLIVIHHDVESENDKTYMILNEYEGYTLRNLESGVKATGYSSTIEELIQSINDKSYTHYSQEEYELLLHRKVVAN